MSEIITGNPANITTPLTRSINGAAPGTGGAIVLSTTAPHLFATFDTVVVSGVGGTTEANGTWTITVIDSTHFLLNGSTLVHAYTSGGTAVDQSLTPAMQVPDDGEAGTVASILASIASLADRTQYLNQIAAYAKARVGLVRNGSVLSVSSFIDTAGTVDDPSFSVQASWADTTFNPAHDFALRTLSHTNLNAWGIRLIEVFVSGTVAFSMNSGFSGTNALKARQNLGGGTSDIAGNILHVQLGNGSAGVNFATIPFSFQWAVNALGSGDWTSDITFYLSGQMNVNSPIAVELLGSYNVNIRMYADSR